MSPVVISVVNPKGGAGKTTAAAYMCCALVEAGHRVLAVDADPQGSLYSWQQLAGLPFAAARLAVPTLHRDLAGSIGPSITAVVIDTPGTAHGRPIMVSAIRAATHVLVPLAPAPIEYERLRVLRELLDDAATRPYVAVLLVKTVGRISRRIYREQATADGWRVLAGDVPRREQYAQAYGAPIERASATGYGDAVAELLNENGPGR